MSFVSDDELEDALADLRDKDEIIKEICGILNPLSFRLVTEKNVVTELEKILEEYQSDIERLSKDILFLDNKLEELMEESYG